MTTTSTETIRAQRQARLDRKIDRMRTKAERLEREAEPLMADFNRARQDHAWLTQPGHIPGRRRIIDKYDRGLQKMMEAKELRERADELERRGAVVAGDAERKRQQQREALDRIITKGSRVEDFAFGPGTVVRVNKKSYTIQFDRGSKYARDKTYVVPLMNEGDDDDRGGTA